jgi:hypothetical protein
MNPAKGAPALLLCLLAGGCYTYRPLRSPAPGTDVRVRLTTEAAVRRSAGLEDPILHIDGTVVVIEPDTIALDVLLARSYSAFQNVTIRDTVRVGTPEIASLLARQLSLGRSVLVTVAAGAAAFVIVKGIEQVVGGTGDDDGNGPPGVRVPVSGRVLGALLGRRR